MSPLELLQQANAILDAMEKRLDKRLDTMNERLEVVEQNLPNFGHRADSILSELDAVGHRRRFVPPLRPRTFHSATELWSVTYPITRRLGHMG